MRVHELRALLDSADDGNMVTSQLVMAIDPERPVPLVIKDVKVETDEDGSGAETVWIIVEEM